MMTTVFVFIDGVSGLAARIWSRNCVILPNKSLFAPFDKDTGVLAGRGTAAWGK